LKTERKQNINLNPSRVELNATAKSEALQDLRTSVTTALSQDSVKPGPFDGGKFTRATGYKDSRLKDQKGVFRMAA